MKLNKMKINKIKKRIDNYHIINSSEEIYVNTLKFMKDSDISERLNIEINKTPSGDLRNLLCDINIIFQTLLFEES